MSCTTASNRFSQWASRMGGVTRLAGQRAFYAGLAAGVAGTLGAQQVIKRARRRQAGSFPFPRTPQPGTRERPRPIPTLDGDQVGTAEKSERRDQPRQIPALAGDKPGTQARPRRIPLLERHQPQPIPGLAIAPPPPAETKLQPESLQVRSANGQVIIVPDSYRLVRSDGSDTGLALTPTLNANGEIIADSWGITHTVSGSLVSGPHPDLKQAQALATQLAGLRWGNLRVPATDVEQARQIIAAFQPGGKN
ncbi:MAG: hypothetical protein KJ077_20195 [Anaerolineae bacterium]|nr:hypothetical protein [Anaerolineae bacterium]